MLVRCRPAGHAITATYPLSYRPTRIGNLTAYRVNGTPADCVALGAHHWESVDLVLSGLNLGFNLGNAIWHSGTLAAAKQAVLLGLRGVALSVPAGIDQDFEPVKPWIRRVLEIVIAEPSLSLVNVNVPREPRGLLWTNVSVRQYDGRIVPTKDPQGPRSVLVYGEAARPRGGRHRSLGRRAGVDLDDAVANRSYRRGAASLGGGAPAAGPRAGCGSFARRIVIRSGESGTRGGSRRTYGAVVRLQNHRANTSTLFAGSVSAAECPKPCRGVRVCGHPPAIAGDVRD